MSATPLVIGGAGFIGSALVRHLAESGRCASSTTSPPAQAAQPRGGRRGRLHRGRPARRGRARRDALTDVGVVYHLACLGVRHSIHQPWRNHEVNADGTLRILEALAPARGRPGRLREHLARSMAPPSACRWTRTTRPGRTRSTAAPSWPARPTPGPTTCTYGMPTVVIRPFNAFGPRSHHEGDSGEVIPKFVVRAKNGLPPIIFGDGEQTRDFTFVEDTARGHRRRRRAPTRAVGATINIGTGHEITVNELARLVGEATGTGLCAGVPPAPARRRAAALRRLRQGRRPARLEAEVSLARRARALVAWHDEQGTDWPRALDRGRAAQLGRSTPDGGTVGSRSRAPRWASPSGRRSGRSSSPGWVTQGPQVEAFERGVADYCNAEHAVAVSSCTTALHLVPRRRGSRPRRRGDRAVDVVHRDGQRRRPCRRDTGVRRGRAATRSTSTSTARRRRITPTHHGDRARAPARASGRHRRVHGARRRARPRSSRMPPAPSAAATRAADRRAQSASSRFSFHPRKLVTTGDGGMVAHLERRVRRAGCGCFASTA